MKTILLLAIALISTQLLWSQGFIDLSKYKIKKKVEKNIRKHGVHTIIQEEANTMTVLTRDSSVRPLDETYYFDSKGKCIKEVVKFDCDSCAQKYLTKALGMKGYKWKKVGPSQYYAAYWLKRMLTEQPVGKDGSRSFVIEKIDITKKQYKQLIAADQ